MKAGLLLTGSGALIYLTSHASFMDHNLITKLETKGISKFIAYEISIDDAREKYKGHFDIVLQDLRETDDLRILDYDGSRAFKMFALNDLGKPYIHE